MPRKTYFLLENRRMGSPRSPRYALVASDNTVTNWADSVHKALSADFVSLTPEGLEFFKLVLENEITSKYPHINVSVKLELPERPTLEYLQQHHPELLL